MAAPPKTFTVTGLMEIHFSIEVEADSKDEAMEKAGEMGSSEIRDNGSTSEIVIDLLFANEDK